MPTSGPVSLITAAKRSVADALNQLPGVRGVYIIHAAAGVVRQRVNYRRTAGEVRNGGDLGLANLARSPSVLLESVSIGIQLGTT